MKSLPFLVLIFLCASASAQYKIQNNVGLKVGINTSSLTGNNYTKRNGNEFEIFLEASSPNKNITAQSGTGLSFQGAEKEGFQSLLTPSAYTANFPSGQVPKYVYADIKKEIKLTYLTQTAVLIIYQGKRKKHSIKPYFAPGLFITILLSAKEVVKGTSMVYLDSEKTQPISGSINLIDETRSVKRDMHTNNMGVLGHLGIEFPFGKNKFFLEAGGSYGFFNINKKKERGTAQPTTLFAKLGCALSIKTLRIFRGKED